MKITRLYTGPDGESHFEEIEIPLKDDGDLVRISEVTKVKGIYFRETGKDHDSGWINAPGRQFVIPLEGEFEVEIGNGIKRRFGPGDILLAEDTRGRGHIARTVGDKRRRTVAVTLS